MRLHPAKSSELMDLLMSVEADRSIRMVAIATVNFRYARQRAPIRAQNFSRSGDFHVSLLSRENRVLLTRA